MTMNSGKASESPGLLVTGDWLAGHLGDPGLRIIAATLDAFVLTLLGHTAVSVYDGSLREWARDPALPMETD